MEWSTSGWKLLLVAHVLSAVIAFGPLYVYPLFFRLAAHRSAVERAAVAEIVRAVRRKVSDPAFVLVGPLGLATTVTHPDGEMLNHAWVRWAIALWVIAVSVVWFVQRPLGRRVALRAGELAAAVDDPVAARNAGLRLASATTWLTRVTWVSWVGLVVMLWLMVFKPGQ